MSPRCHPESENAHMFFLIERDRVRDRLNIKFVIFGWPVPDVIQRVKTHMFFCVERDRVRTRFAYICSVSAPTFSHSVGNILCELDLNILQEFLTFKFNSYVSCPQIEGYSLLIAFFFWIHPFFKIVNPWEQMYVLSTRRNMYKHAHTHKYTQKHTQRDTHSHTNTHTHTRAHTQHANTHILSHTQTHTHTHSHVRSSFRGMTHL